MMSLMQCYHCRWSGDEVYSELKRHRISNKTSDGRNPPYESGKKFRIAEGRILALQPSPSLGLMFPGE
jgi:hypothetical protein